MDGKRKCQILKDIRRQIALDNNILLVTSECKHQGECKGTCPKCESEVRFLEKELEEKKKKGQFITLAGLALVSSIGLASCKNDVEGDIAEPPAFYDSSLPGKENACREQIYRDLVLHIQHHYKPGNNENAHITITLSPEGEITEIREVDPGKTVPEELRQAILSIPEKQLEGLTHEFQLTLAVEAINEESCYVYC